MTTYQDATTPDITQTAGAPVAVAPAAVTTTDTTTAESAIREAIDQLVAEQHIPSATYRLQFNAGFTFQDAKRLLSYLDTLGISDLYASPIFTPRQGSSHGYDVA